MPERKEWESLPKPSNGIARDLLGHMAGQDRRDRE
jgi:hypothetical protein